MTKPPPNLGDSTRGQLGSAARSTAPLRLRLHLPTYPTREPETRATRGPRPYSHRRQAAQGPPFHSLARRLQIDTPSRQLPLLPMSRLPPRTTVTTPTTVPGVPRAGEKQDSDAPQPGCHELQGDQ
eukprot:CAMPEP_0119475438 /NCGR_PEP_ID=MMETSP1344-20130328/6333_1 /TAXON_ID=236787 /ORGANISM="Florenciella parvula, Strain CCMP2471" /LENGTH=125 /DNA_ID=CAMNT_0007508969 /DNA_START=203 /DNA_END=578 /DNA_ORIENTATION=-